MTPESGTFSMSASPLLGRLPLAATKQRLLKQKYHNAVTNITIRSVTNAPRKKPPVPDTVGSLTVGHSDATTRQRDNWVLPHAWHHDAMSRTASELTSLTNWSRGHGSLHLGMLYFVNGSCGWKTIPDINFSSITGYMFPLDGSETTSGGKRVAWHSDSVCKIGWPFMRDVKKKNKVEIIFVKKRSDKILEKQKAVALL